MSIASMADGAIQRKLTKAGAATTVVPRPATGEAAARTITPLKTASDVARYIPTEAIALYIAILAGAFGPLQLAIGKKANDLDYSSRWHFYFIMLGVTVSLVWLMGAGASAWGARLSALLHDVSARSRGAVRV